MTNSNKKDESQKPKIQINRRENTGKKKPDLFAKFRNNEHPLDKIIPELPEHADTLEAEPTPPTQATPPTSDTQPTPPILKPVSPKKDYGKVANSIVRDAMAQGIFIGKSKQIYDFLYLQTRAAVQPKRSIRMTKGNLMRGSAIGSERTLLKNLNHLKFLGLVKITEFDGQHGGNEYEIFLPEETQATPPTPPTARQSPNPPQKVGTVPPAESGVSGVGQTSMFAGENIPLRHSFKDIEGSDDERFRVFRKLESAAREKTGRDLTEKDYSALLDVFDLLIAETEIAAARTNSISAYIPFMAENLRRRLHAKPKFEKKGTEAKKDTVGKTSISAPEPLDEESKVTLLKTYREGFTNYGMEWVDQNERFFTPEDWEWLKSNLEAED